MRRWIKLWVRESLTGTVRFDFTPAERGVWYDLLLLAGNCRLEGIIAAGPGVPYPHSWIAGTLNAPIKLVDEVLKKCEESGRIHENSNGILILNWHKYQSEYERQKPYREGRKQTRQPSSEEIADNQRRAALHFAIKAKRKEVGRELTLEEMTALRSEHGFA